MSAFGIVSERGTRDSDLNQSTTLSGVTHSELDPLELYRWAVQDPETHAIVLRTIYAWVRSGRQPVVLREDFAGTCAESVAWVALRRGRRAIAIDLDGPTLAWAQHRAVRLLGSRASEIQFVQADVRSVGPPEVPPADIISVLNYSILYPREPDELSSYLRQALSGLAADGMLVLNLFGGSAATRPGTTRRHVRPQPRLPTEPPFPEFDYVWEVRSFEPASRRIDCRIHFEVPGSVASGHSREVRDAFRYDWRLWSVAELAEACARAGFSDVQVWRHTYDPSKGADGVFLGPIAPEGLLELDRWSAYLVAGR